ncbi:MAG: helical backbone metal receptor [Nannocystaceae bacterium]
MRKPEHQWETRSHRARRRSELEPEWRDAPRAESFDLEPVARLPAGKAWFSLDRQVIDLPLAALDDDFVHAASCWVVARGGRTVNLHDARGTCVAFAPIDVWALGLPPLVPPTALVTLCPSNAEMVAALGRFDRVIACEDSSDYPLEVRERERLGPDLDPDLDRVAELYPSLVVSSLSVPGMERVVTGLRARRIPQAVLAPRSIADVEAELVALGRWLGAEEAGVAALARFRAERAELEASRAASRVRVYLEWWPRPMFTPGADCYSNELIALAGGVNVFGERPGSSLEIRPEELVAAAPDLCFVSWCGVAEDKLDPDNLIRRPGLEGLAAAQEGRVFRLDEAFSGRPGPRMLEASRRMQLAIRQALAAAS